MNRIDLSTLDTGRACDKGADIELHHPVTNARLGVFVSVLGQDSSAFRNKNREFANARIRREQYARGRGKKEEVRTVEDAEEENIALLAECTTGWYTQTDKGKEPVITLGEPTSFSKDAAVSAYRKYSWIYDQVSAGVTDLSNFLK